MLHWLGRAARGEIEIREGHAAYVAAPRDLRRAAVHPRGGGRADERVGGLAEQRRDDAGEEIARAAGA